MDALNPEGAKASESELIDAELAAADHDGETELVDAEPNPGGARVRAAGGVVGRHGRSGTEVLLVHRPRFDDWSLPKGKLKRGEHPIAGAVREVREETGVTGLVGARLPTVQYDVWSGDALAEKSVDYWAMTAAGGATDRHPFRAGEEVDDIAWLPVAKALDQLSYPHDKRVLRAYAELPLLRRPVLLIRHASAGDRSKWSGPDIARPLDEAGVEQAATLAKLLRHFGPAHLVSAEPVRCEETLAPLAASLGLPVEIEPRFNEHASAHTAAAALRAMADPDASVVVCSQRALIPSTVSALNGGSPTRYHTAKGNGWVLSFSDTRLAAVDALILSI